jgi:hypothetical protein
MWHGVEELHGVAALMAKFQLVTFNPWQWSILHRCSLLYDFCDILNDDLAYFMIIAVILVDSWYTIIINNSPMTEHETLIWLKVSSWRDTHLNHKHFIHFRSRLLDHTEQAHALYFLDVRLYILSESYGFGQICCMHLYSMEPPFPSKTLATIC